MTENLAELNATEAAGRIAKGEISAVDFTTACIGEIDANEQIIGAWAAFDAEHALAQAQALDEYREQGHPIGPLHGVPVGIKDIFDTSDMATENGTVLDAGRRPEDDSAVVSRIRQAGGIVLGKTVTTELAVFHPGKTANPHDRTRTPGGSSSGSAAAVAANMVPLSVGSQTTGSTIRPASFCGIYGFKPTFGLISRAGALLQSPPLDTVGLFARSLGDLALLGDVLVGHDRRDAGSRPYGPANLGAILDQGVPVDPTFALVKSPVWDKADGVTKGAFEELSDALGDLCDEVDLPEPFDTAHDCHRALMVADFAKSFAPYYERGKDQLSGMLRGLIEEGHLVLAVDYNLALDWRDVLLGGLDQIFSRYDTILTPAAPGEAPPGLETTGDPSFCTIWTYCGLPAVSLPVFEGENGLPIGLQMVAAPGQDGRLLRTAAWLTERLAGDDL